MPEVKTVFGDSAAEQIEFYHGRLDDVPGDWDAREKLAALYDLRQYATAARAVRLLASLRKHPRRGADGRWSWQSDAAPSHPWFVSGATLEALSAFVVPGEATAEGEAVRAIETGTAMGGVEPAYVAFTSRREAEFALAAVLASGEVSESLSAPPKEAGHCFHPEGFGSWIGPNDKMTQYEVCCFCRTRRYPYREPPKGHGPALPESEWKQAGYRYADGVDQDLCQARKA